MAVLAPIPAATAAQPATASAAATSVATSALSGTAPSTTALSTTALSTDTVALEAESTGVTVTASATAAGVLRPGEGLRINATVVNERSATVNDAVVSVQLASSRSNSAAALDAWFSTGENPDPSTHLASSAPIDVAPRSSAAVAIELTPEQIALGDAGAYQLTVSVAAAGIDLAVSRSAIIWSPDAVTSRVSVGVIAPISVPYTPDGLITAADLEQFTGPAGVLGQRLQSVIGRPVTLATDPMVAASIRTLGTSAPESATQWLTRLSSATNDSFALPYANADATATLQAAGVLPTPSGFEFAMDPQDFASDALPDGEIDPLLPDASELMAVPQSLGPIAWTRPGTLASGDLAQLRAAGYPTVLLSSADVQGEGIAPVVSIDGGPVVIAHAELSALLDATVDATTETEWNRNASRLLSTLATTALRNGGRTVVLTLDPPGTTDLGQRLTPTLELLSTQAWASLSPLTPILEGAASAPEATLIEGAQPAERVETVARLLEAEHRDSLIATAAAEPSLLVDERRLALLSVLTGSLAAHPEAWAAASTAFLDRSAALANAVHVAERGQILVLADRTQLPITVQNDLDQVAIVTVQTRALTGGLAIEQQRIEVMIEPQSQRNVQVPVQSVSNGAVTVVVSLTSAAGISIGEPVSLQVNVQAGWETAGFIGVMALVLLVFIVGVVRTVLRRRRARRELDAGEQADDVAQTAPGGEADAGAQTETGDQTDAGAEADAAATRTGEGDD